MTKNEEQTLKLRVLDLSMFWAGAMCAQLLGDMGAEVIKIESCQHPDPDRIVTQGQLYLHNELGEEPWNRGMLHLRRHRNKLCITLDLSQTKGRDVFLKLVKKSDIVVENFRIGVLEKLGIPYNVLQEANPKIILLSVSSQGDTGPERTYGSNAEILAFTSGLRSVSDYEDEIGMFTATNIPDPLSGTVAAGFALAALRHRRKTGEGSHVVISQRELLTGCIGDLVMDYSMNKRVPGPKANNHPVYAPHNCYPCKGRDSWITIAIRSDTEWEIFCQVMDRLDLAAEPKYLDGAGRLKHSKEIDEIIADWTRQHDRKELMALLQKKDIAAGAALTAIDLLDDPHLEARGFWDKINDPRPGFGEYICKGRGINLSKTPLKTRLRAPDLGEHNTYVYGELLGMTKDEITGLEKDGIIGTIPTPDVLKRIPKILPPKNPNLSCRT
ncbi:MAG: CoA transferase [Deltaproteobacteria bacterium]|nr:CoA transferase [Deltaproteobacteria bacterium]